MATQTYVTEMQAINPTSVQQTSQPAVVTVTQAGNQHQAIQSQAPSQPQQKPVQTSNNQPQHQHTQPQATIIQPAQSGQQFIVTISGEPTGEQQVQDAVQLPQGTGQVVYPAHQYVEGSTEPTIYAASNGQMQTYTYGQSTMYTPVSETYYQTSGSTGTQQMSGLQQMGSIQGQIVTHQGSTYLVQQGTMDGEGHPLTHTTRASPATVQWLMDNYETAEGVSLPRSTLYNHYLRHCQEQKLDPMNPASFGKLIRSVFLGLRTRRLGTRGNSKYHYYGIRIKATSPLNQFTDDQTMAMRQTPANQGKRFKPAGMARADGTDSQDGGNSQQSSDSVNSQQAQHQQFLGDASGAIPSFEMIELEDEPLPDGITEDNLRMFEQLYKEHCEAILDVVVNLQFTLIEALWQAFWRNMQPDQLQSLDTNAEARLPKSKLYAMCKMEAVQSYVRRSDYAFYQALVEVLIPDVLRPIPSSLTQAIRNFAKSLESWLKNATSSNVPEEMIKTKIGAVSAFAQTLRRYTSLNHLAQAARAVLQNTSQINQMLTDLNRVDFANVQEQASWVCQCDDAVVHQLEQDFKKTLQQQNSLEQWAVWLEGVVNQVLRPHEGSPNFPKAARQFLLKWSFYSSMVIRDLTLRSAASFGSFHLIRLLYDEYMFYLVEHKVAAATNETPIAVMGEVRQFIDLGNVMSLGSMDSDPGAEAGIIKAMSPVSANTNKISMPVSTVPATINHTPTPITVVPAANVLTPANGLATMNATPGNPVQVTTSQAGSTQVLATGTGLNNGNPTTVTVLTSATPVSHQGATKTIVVVPVSTTTGSGDAQPKKKKVPTATLR